MWTTILNPTNWLLLLGAATLVGTPSWRRALAGSLRSRRGVALVVLFVMAAATAAGARLAWGFIAPGVYLEEVAAARLLLEGRSLDATHQREAVIAWSEETDVSLPWLLDEASCRASAAAARAEFFTTQGHPPLLLVGSAPIVRLLGARGLFVVIAVLSIAALALAGWALAGELAPAAGRLPRLLTIAALLAWQPVLAGLRQGDASIVAAALSVGAWLALRRDRPALGGLAAGLAASVTPGMLVLLPALAVVSTRSLLTGAATVAAGFLLPGAIVGWTLLSDVLTSAYTAATTYAAAPFNYSLVGRSLAGQPWAIWLGSGLLVACAAALARLAARPSDEAGGGPHPRDRALPLCCCLAVLGSPVAWSQQLAFLLLPLAVLASAIATRGVRAHAVAWAAAALLVSLPDGPVRWLAEATATLAGVASDRVVPVPTIAVVAAALWLAGGWTGAARAQLAAQRTSVDVASAGAGRWSER
jgi:hypothetical protein